MGHSISYLLCLVYSRVGHKVRAYVRTSNTGTQEGVNNVPEKKRLENGIGKWFITIT